MKKRLLDIIRCTLDGSEFDLEVSKSRAEKIVGAACKRVFRNAANQADIEERYGEEILGSRLFSRKSHNTDSGTDGVPRLVPDTTSGPAEASGVPGPDAGAHSDECSPESFGLLWSNYQFEDHYSPRCQFRYRPREIRQFFEDPGMDAIEDMSLENGKRPMVAFVGTKQAAPEVPEPEHTKARIEPSVVWGAVSLQPIPRRPHDHLLAASRPCPVSIRPVSHGRHAA